MIWIYAVSSFVQIDICKTQFMIQSGSTWKLIGYAIDEFIVTLGTLIALSRQSIVGLDIQVNTPLTPSKLF